MGEKEQEYLELEQNYAVIDLPKNAVEVELNVKVYHEGKIRKVGRTLNMEDIREAFYKAEEGYIDPDTLFYATNMPNEECGHIDEETEPSCDDEEA